MALSKKTKDRLMRLIRLMENLPKSASRHFDMGHWIKHEGDHNHFAGKELTREHLTKCGTSACALGWAATDPYFKSLGVKIGFKNGEMTGWGKTGRRFASDVSMPAFGISYGQHLELFECNLELRYPKSWAKRARSLIKQWEKENVPA